MTITISGEDAKKVEKLIGGLRVDNKRYRHLLWEAYVSGFRAGRALMPLENLPADFERWKYAVKLDED